ncbi:MAG: ATP-binding protein [Candidatus Cloacimonadaceae bacterium]
MTAKNKANMPLTNALLLLKQFSSALPFGIMVCDLNGEVYYRNDIFEQWMPDHHADNTLWFNQMQPYLEQDFQPDSSYFDAPVQWLLDHNANQERELEVTCRGSKVFFKQNIHPLYDEKNKLCGLIEVTQNITEQKSVEKSLEHARRFETVGRLASGIAHDFNNILQVINGHSEMLMESRTEDLRLLHSLEVILSSGQKASALTRQLLLFSRRQSSNFRQVNLGKHLLGMHKILARMLGEDIIMQFECNDADLFIEADESQVEQIIMNLAINARDAMPEGGSIKIITGFYEIDAELQKKLPFTRPGKYVRFSFSDSGSGIPNEALDHIFEPFYSTKEVGRGTGLGLATIYGIVKQHNGFIFVEDTSEAGTTFTICFPLSEIVCEPEASAPAYVPQPGLKKQILVVEDEETVQELALEVLTRYDYVVTCAASLAQARELVQHNVYDLFLIDIVLPDGNGVTLLESLQGKNAEAAFILSSGYTEDKPQIKNTIYKGYSFLHKPFTINTLLQACSEALLKKNS